MPSPSFIACWSLKGGAGTTVVAAALAVALATRDPAGALLVDLAGDAAALFGLDDDQPGVGDWLAAGAGVPPDGWARLERPVAPGLAVVPAGGTPPAGGERAEVLAAVLAGEHRAVVVDCGVLAPAVPVPARAPGGRADASRWPPDGAVVPAGERGASGARQPDGCAPDHAGAFGAAHVLASTATRSLLVTRPCYLALRRVAHAPVHPSGVVLVTEPARALRGDDVAAVVGAPVLATVPVDPVIARAVDAGVLATRLPRLLERALRAVV